jgi:hypothetical protein
MQETTTRPDADPFLSGLIERGDLRSLGFANGIDSILACSLKNQIRRVYHKAPLFEAD